MKKCVSCGTEMSDNINFCAMCGGNVFQPIMQNQESNVQMPQDDFVQTAQPTQVGQFLQTGELPQYNAVPIKKERKPVSGGAKFVSSVCAFFLTNFLIILSVTMLIKFSLSEDSLASMGNKLEGEIADIQVGFLDKSLDEDATLADFIFAETMKVREEYSSYVNADINEDIKESIEDILDASFLIEFVTDTLNDYISFILYDEGKGYIKADDVIELIEDNRKKVEALSNNDVNKKFLQMIEDAVETSGALEATDFRKVEENNEGLFNIIRFFFSGVVQIVLIVMSLLLIVLIFVLRRDRNKAFTKTGGAFITTGIVSLLVLIGTFVAGSMLNKSYPFGDDVYNAVLSPIRRWGIIETIVFLLVGILLIIVGKVIKRKYK